MILRNIETLQPNPNNDHPITDEGKRLLLNAMSLGDHGSFLITPEGMLINGNNRWLLRNEAGWENSIVGCKVLTYGQDDQGYYAIIDGEVVKEHEVIPHHYPSVESMYHAYAFTANAQAAYYDKSIVDKFEEWQLSPDAFNLTFFPPKSVEETLKDIKKLEAKKKYQLIVICEDESDMDTKYEALTSIGLEAKRKI